LTFEGKIRLKKCRLAFAFLLALQMRPCERSSHLSNPSYSFVWAFNV